MKKLLIALILIPSLALAAGSYVYQTPVTSLNDNMKTFKFQCKGDTTTGAITNTDTNAENTRDITGWFLTKVLSIPGTTAPQNSDVKILDTNGEDLLESGGNMLIRTGSPTSIYPATSSQIGVKGVPILGTITIQVDKQHTASALWDIQLVFERDSE